VPTLVSGLRPGGRGFAVGLGRGSLPRHWSHLRRPRRPPQPLDLPAGPFC